MKRAVVLLPNGFTLFNLLCGIYAIVLAIRGNFAAAPSFIVLGGIADTLDGRVARATGTGSRFGEELDSLVDAISFGLAPALMMFLELPDAGTWGWLLVFIFTSCAVMRLARFNVEQAGRKKTHFHGLPSPAAGLTLATYYWFSQSPLYNQTVILFTDSKTLSDLPWHAMMRGLMAVLAALMISDVPYPAMPAIGFNSLKRIFGTLVIVTGAILLLLRRVEFIFPALLAYVLYGAIKWVILGFAGRSTTPDQIFFDERRGRWRNGRQAGARTAASAPAAGDGLPASTGSEFERSDRLEARPERRPADREPRREERRPEEVPQAARRKRRRRGRGHRPPGTTPPGPSLPDSPSGPAE